MEAIAALGGKTVPAIITNAPLRERHLMSLIENIARKRPPLSDLMTEAPSLQERGYNSATIAEKLRVGKQYLDGIVRLLRCGEDQLVSRVAAGTVPLYVAIKIATATDGDVQKASQKRMPAGNYEARSCSPSSGSLPKEPQRLRRPRVPRPTLRPPQKTSHESINCTPNDNGH